MNRFKKEAVNLRESGYSYAMIGERLGIAKSTLSTWFRDVPFKPNKEVLKRIQYGPIKSATKSHNQRIAESEALRLQGIQDVGKLSSRDKLLLGIGLYIGEGSKLNEQIQVVNSDPAVIKAMIHWFVTHCGLEKENMCIALHVYPDTNIQAAMRFWKDQTGLQDSNFNKTQIDRRTNKSKIKHNSLPHGTADLRVRSNGNPEKGVRLYRRLRGWLDGALGQMH